MYIFFKKYLSFWERLIKFAGIKTEPKKFCNNLLITSFFIAAAIGIFISGEFFTKFLAFAIAFGAVHIAVYAYLVLESNSRAAKVEEVLPDFLSLVASNIRAGLTTDRALITAARDEFGPLTQAIHASGKNIITGMPLEQAMTQFYEHIDSDVLRKTMRLIIEGMQSGGEIAELMEKTALDIRKFRSVKKEINSIILNYKLFIIAAITIGAPLLYAVSTFLVDIMIAIKSKITKDALGGASAGIQIGLFKGQLMLTSEAITFFALISIMITVFFGCMVVGVMGSGKRMDGLKYFPFLAVIAVSILFGIRTALGALIRGMMGV